MCKSRVSTDPGNPGKTLEKNLYPGNPGKTLEFCKIPWNFFVEFHTVTIKTSIKYGLLISLKNKLREIIP